MIETIRVDEITQVAYLEWKRKGPEQNLSGHENYEKKLRRYD